MCTRGLTTDMGDKQDSTETQKLSTNITETRNVVKENVNLKISKAKTAQNQGSTKTQNVGTRAKETRNIVNGKNALKTDSNRKMQPRDTSGILQVEPKSELKFRGKLNFVTVLINLKGI